MSLRIFGQYDLLYEMCRSYIFHITRVRLFLNKQYDVGILGIFMNFEENQKSNNNS